MTPTAATTDKSAPTLPVVRHPLIFSALNQALFTQLANDSGLDGATARHHLAGRGYSLIGKGGGKQVAKLQRLFSARKIESWLLAPTPPPQPPARARSASLTETAPTINSNRGELTIDRNVRCRIVLADISGQAVSRRLKRIQAQNLYQGKDHLDLFDRNELCRQILLGRPSSTSTCSTPISRLSRERALFPAATTRADAETE